jgi:hypothetical protein
MNTSFPPVLYSLSIFFQRIALRTRCKASAVHLAVSALLACLITIPIVVWLYPFPFFKASGGFHLLGMLVAIDVILGPILTFFIFDLKKKSLRFDLSVIAGIQIAALIYGLFATAASRPVFMTFVVDRFELVSKADVDPDELDKGPREIQNIRWGHPELAYAEQPSSLVERSTIMFASMNGVDLNRLFRYYRPFELAKPKIVLRAKPLAELYAFNDKKKLDDTLALFPGIPLAYIPLQGQKADLTVLVNRETGSLVKVVDLSPWPPSK